MYIRNQNFIPDTYVVIDSKSGEVILKCKSLKALFDIPLGEIYGGWNTPHEFNFILQTPSGRKFEAYGQLEEVSTELDAYPEYMFYTNQIDIAEYFWQSADGGRWYLHNEGISLIIPVDSDHCAVYTSTNWLGIFPWLLKTIQALREVEYSKAYDGSGKIQYYAEIVDYITETYNPAQMPSFPDSPMDFFKWVHDSINGQRKAEA